MFFSHRERFQFERFFLSFKDPQRFYNDFKNAYIKMLQTGTTDLVSKGSTCGCQEEV
jgi:hypothetical protein